MDVVMMTGQGLFRIMSGDFEALMASMGDWNMGNLLRAIGYTNPLFFELLDRGEGGTFDPEEKQRIHDQLTRIFQADVPQTFLHPSRQSSIASTRVRGLDGSPWRGDLVLYMEDLWLEDQG
jgi:hypothetical protein